MDALPRTGTRALAACLAAMLIPVAAPGQLISLKTVPVVAGSQFQIYPSRNLGMGGVSIALADTLLDPFVHPAKAARIAGQWLTGTPSFYDIEGDAGGGRTLPVAALFGSERWFAAAAVAFQQLDVGARDNPIIVPLPRDPRGCPACEWDGTFAQRGTLADRNATNTYAHALLGVRVPGQAAAVAGSIAWADLSAVDGVDLLYTSSQDVDQAGSMVDYRVGLVGDQPSGQSFELLVLHSRLEMEHDVTYLDWVWDTVQYQGRVVERVEKNLDHTRTWGVHAGLVQPLQDGVRLGAAFTANWKSHPKLPNYELMNIPRDPGDSRAYNFGVGLARVLGPTRFGLDLVYEPARSETWAQAAEPVPTVTGDTLPAGARTVENDFHFRNKLLRLGLGREDERWGFQLGLQVRFIEYELEQFDFVQKNLREQRERWAEWTPTWGLVFKFPEVQLRYFGRVTTGTGRPGIVTRWQVARAELAAASDFLVAPAGPLTLQEAHVLTHQIGVTLPLGAHPATTPARDRD